MNYADRLIRPSIRIGIWPTNDRPRRRRRRWLKMIGMVILLICLSLAAVDNGSCGSICQGQEASPPSVTPPSVESQFEATAKPKGMNLLSLMAKGGWFMLPLLALSMLVVAIALERFIALRRNRVFPDRFWRQLSRLSGAPGGLDPRRAYEICQQYPSVASSVFKSLLVKVGRPQAELETAVIETSQRQTTRLLQWVSWLGLAAAIAPLIGLLGTVWGITQSFYDTTQLVAGQNRAEALAEGIYTALVTTMFGLIIAIPAAVLAHYFENRVVAQMNEIEEMLFHLMPQLERYEGKIRFSEIQPVDAPAVDNHHSSAGSLSPGESPPPLLERNRSAAQSRVAK